METFSDIFKKSFLEGSATQISIPGIFLVLGLSLIVAGYIYIVYKKCYIGVIYRQFFAGRSLSQSIDSSAGELSQ